MAPSVNAPIFNQAAVVALRIALFRAGPQDLPYAPALTAVTVPLVTLGAFLQYRLTVPGPAAMVHAVAWVAAIALFTFALLQSRGLMNRFRQTLDSVLLIEMGMTVLMLPALAAIAPQMMKIAQNPDLARSDPLPALPALAVLGLLMWNLMVSAHIYRQALDSSPAVGLLMALLAAVVSSSLASGVGTLLT